MIKICIVASILHLIYGLIENDPNAKFKIAEVIEYTQIFSRESQLSVIVLSCGGKNKLQLTLKSFFYFNTYPISKMFIAHCSTESIPIETMLPYGYALNRQKFEVIPAKDKQTGLIDALQNIYQKVTTKYVYQLDAQWVMIKGFGFIQQALNILKYGSTTQDLKISQIVSNYPYWRSLARLTQMTWTPTNQAFHKIVAFSPQQYSYFTLTPSVFQLNTIFLKIFKKQMRTLCSTSKCSGQKYKQLYQFDRCCLWALGQQLKVNEYSQIYFNDGTSQPNHEYLQS